MRLCVFTMARQRLGVKLVYARVFIITNCPHRLQCPVSLRTVEDGNHRLARPQDIELILEALTELLNPEECTKPTEQEQED